MLRPRNTSSEPTPDNTLAIHTVFLLRSLWYLRTTNHAQHARSSSPVQQHHLKVPLKGCNIQPNPFDDLQGKSRRRLKPNISRLQICRTFPQPLHGPICVLQHSHSPLDSSMSVVLHHRQPIRSTSVTVRCIYVRIYYRELCYMPQTFLEQRGASQHKILYTHLRTAFTFEL